VAGGAGWLTDRAAVHAGWRFPSTGYLVGELVWKAWTFAVLVWAVSRLEGHSIDAETADLRAAPSAFLERFPVALALVVGAAAFGLSTLVGSSAGNANA
jgi:hypothetical protein